MSSTWSRVSMAGPTIISNLALPCHRCNLCKGTNLTGIDPVTKEIVRLSIRGVTAGSINELERAGFRVIRQEGSHVRLCRGTVRVTVPLHTAVAPGTLKAILRKSGITIDEFIAALK